MPNYLRVCSETDVLVFLLQEVEGLEQKKQFLQNEIKKIRQEQENLEFLLEAHDTSSCRLNLPNPPSPIELKPFVFETEPRVLVQSQPRCDAATISSFPSAPRRPQLGATANGGKPSRPSSLPVDTKPPEIAGIPITTPSSVIFNFDSLMQGGTGLTPVGLMPMLKDGLSPLIPSCSSQQRGNVADLVSPESSYPPKLVSL